MMQLFSQLLNADDFDIPKEDLTYVRLDNILNLILSLVASLSVIGIIISGIRYITSAGDPQQISKAKNALIYSIVGLIIALFSIAIVEFVIDGFEA